MTSWEEGIFCIESEYYMFTENAPYSPPFTFKAILDSGEAVEAQNVINSMESGDSGTLVSSPKSQMESDTESESGFGSTSYTEYGGNYWWIWIVIPLVLFTVSMVYVFWRMRSTATVSVEDEPSKSEMTTNPKTSGNGEGAEGMETNETVIDVAVQLPKRVLHPAQLNPFDPENRQYLEWK